MLHSGVVRQLNEVVALAAAVPLSRATPTTLAWKLTAIVQALATGAFGDGNHRVMSNEVPALLEQVAAVVDDLPQPPQRYLPHVDEPDLVDVERVRIVVGPGGSGKTSWASRAAVHTPARVVYARALESGGHQFPEWVASHLASNLFHDDREALSRAFRPGSRGTEALRLFDNAIGERGQVLLMLIDDVQERSGQLIG